MPRSKHFKILLPLVGLTFTPKVGDRFSGMSVRELSADLARAQIEQIHSMEVEVTEERAGIAACDSFIMTMTTISSGMDLDAPVTPVSLSMFEPSRRLTSNAPPKRFHRTIWRSLAMRILELSDMRRRYRMSCELAPESPASRG